MKESAENKIPEKKEKPINMNNFPLYLLHGGLYRKFYGDEKAKEKTRLMDAIDELLVSEFSDLNVEEIMSTIQENRKIFFDAMNNPKLSEEERHKVMDPASKLEQEAREKLRPLFNRLIEMGFDPKILTR